MDSFVLDSIQACLPAIFQQHHKIQTQELVFKKESLTDSFAVRRGYCCWLVGRGVPLLSRMWLRGSTLNLPLWLFYKLIVIANIHLQLN